MHNKVGAETSVRLLVKGAMGTKEIGRLIKLLDAQRAVLKEDDDEQEGIHALRDRTIVDVSHFEQPEEGVYILPAFVEGQDYRDLDAKAPIWSIGRHKKTGQYRAALDSRFYDPENSKAEYECVWLR